MGDHSFQPWQLLPERRSSHLSPSNYSHEHGDKPDEGKALIPDSHNVHTETKLKGNSPASSAQKEMSFTSPSAKTRRAQNPNQPRLLSTSCNSWHCMSRAIWQLRATCATSQPCRNWALVLSDPCSPMTNKAPLPTLFSLELRKGGVAVHPPGVLLGHHVQTPTKAHASTASTGMLGPNRTSSLRTNSSFFKKKEEELTIRPVLLWDIPMRGSCAQPHTVPSIQKRPQDLFPQR